MTAMINQEALAKAIKPLVWVRMGDGPRCITVCGMYAIHPSSGPYGTPMLTLTGMPGNLFGKFTTLDEAKAAAQADYVARLLSAFNIEALPHVDRAGVLEERKAGERIAIGVEIELDAARRALLEEVEAVIDAKVAEVDKLYGEAGHRTQEAMGYTIERLSEVRDSIRTLAQPAVNTSPEGVGGAEGEP